MVTTLSRLISIGFLSVELSILYVVLDLVPPSPKKDQVPCLVGLQSSCVNHVITTQRNLDPNGLCTWCNAHDESFLHCIRDYI